MPVFPGGAPAKPGHEEVRDGAVTFVELWTYLGEHVRQVTELVETD